jgi:hypothetical protein
MKKITLIFLWLAVISRLSIAQVEEIKEIDTLSLDDLQVQVALHGGKFYFQKNKLRDFYVTTENKVVDRYFYKEIFPDVVSDDDFFRTYQWINVIDDVVTIGTLNIGLVQFDGNKWHQYDDRNTQMKNRGVWGIATDSKGEYLFNSKEGHNKLCFLKDGNVEVREFEIVGDQNPYFYPNNPFGYYRGHYYVNSSSNQLVKLVGNEMQIIDKGIFSRDSRNAISSAVHSKFYDDKMWFTTVEKLDKKYNESSLVSFDEEKFEVYDFFTERYKNENLAISISDFVFDKDGNLWIILHHIADDVNQTYKTLNKYDQNFELKYELNLSAYPDYDSFQRILYDTVPGGLTDLYIFGYQGFLKVDPNVTSVELVEARASMHFLNLYPNPVSTTTTVEFYATHKAMESLRFRLSDYLGRVYEIDEPDVDYDRTTGKVRAKLNLSNIYPGYYYLLIQDDNYTIGKAVIVR